MKYILLLIFGLISVFPSNANTSDSLLKAYQKQNGAKRVETMHKLASSYFASNSDLSLKYYRLSLSESLKGNDFYLIGKSYTNIAAVNLVKNNYQSALDTFQLSIQYFEKANSKVGAVFAQSQIGTVYSDLGKFDMAIEHYTKALSCFPSSELNDSIRVLSKLKGKLNEDQSRFLNVHSVAINDFGLSKYFLKYYDEALELFRKALDIGYALDRPDRIGAAYSNIGMIYSSLKKRDSALYYYNKAIVIFRSINHLNYLATTLTNVSRIHTDQRAYSQAKVEILESKKYFDLLGDSSTSIFNAIAEIEFRLGNYEKAKELFLEAENIYSRKNLLTQLLDTYLSQANLYADKGDYKKAYFYSNRFNELKDTLFGEKKYDQINNLLAFYEVDTKDKEVLILKKDVELKNAKLKQKESQTIVFISVALLLIAILIALIVILRLRQKSNRIIEQKNIELERLNADLKDLNETKDNFFSIIAHDIKNPIASIKQVSELLNDEEMEMSLEDRKEFLESLTKSSSMLLKLLDNLLTWARSQTGKLACYIDYLDLDQIADGEIAVLKSQADKKNISINYQNNGLKLLADSNMISTVLRNLISNAIKFTPENGKIEMFAEKINNDFAKILVKDSGIGMNEDIKERLFKLGKNRSERGTNNEEGTGLGLLLCKEFVERNNGEIGVESSNEAGTTFYFTLPLFKAEE